MAYRKPDSDKTKKTFLSDKPKKKGQGTHSVKLIDTPEYQAKIESIYDFIKQGYRSNEIYAVMMIDDDKLTPKKFDVLLKNAYAYAENALHKDRDYVFQLHMDRYEDVYRASMIMVDSLNRPLDVRQHWNIITAKYVNALRALESKEKLLGLHDKSVSLEFNDSKVLIEEKESGSGSIPGFDIEKLSLTEQKELLELIRDARVGNIEGIQRVTIKRTVVEINTSTGERKEVEKVETKDIEFEEMPEDVVSKMIKIADPEEEVAIASGPVMIDHVTKKEVVNRDPEELKGSLQRSVLEKFKEKLKEKKK